MINAAIDIPVIEQQNSKTQNVVATAPKNIKKVIKTKATGYSLINSKIKGSIKCFILYQEYILPIFLKCNNLI